MKFFTQKATLLFASILLFACGHKEYSAVGNTDISIFQTTNIHFVPGQYSNKTADENGILHLADGRLILKKIQVPTYDRSVEANIDITVTSNGDAWDKSGSCFVIPTESVINFLNIASEETEYPSVPESLEDFVGVISGDNYKPVVELMRFMTPFGVGFYSDSMEFRRPVYVPHWEKEVKWQQNITDLYSRIEGEVWVGVWIDTWTEPGYNVSLDLSFEESTIACDKRTKTHVEPIANSVYYIGAQKHMDLFARGDLEATVEIPEGAKNVRLKYITTGHGGHAGGDEFVKKTNIVKVDGKEVLNFVPWRDDCASFRRFNPHSGVWNIKTTARLCNRKTRQVEDKEIEERQASSDLSRSNWCPGSDVVPEEVLLTNISAGSHTFTFSIPEAQPIKDNELNHWLISAYLVWDLE